MKRAWSRRWAAAPRAAARHPSCSRYPATPGSSSASTWAEGQVRGAVVNLAGDVSHREHLTLDGRDGGEALADWTSSIDRLVRPPARPPLGIGIGTSGLVDTATGTVRWAVHLDWRDLGLGARVSGRTGLPVYVANDSQAAALAEWTFGRHAPDRGMIVIKVGNGIGAGIIIEDRLYQGDGFGAGEIGHVSVVDNDLPCRCGRTGCLETVASLRAVHARIREAVSGRPRCPARCRPMARTHSRGAWRSWHRGTSRPCRSSSMRVARWVAWWATWWAPSISTTSCSSA